MKRIFFLLFFTGCLLPAFAKHITGGEVIYDYLGPGSAAGSKSYKVTLILFRDDNCVSCAAMPANVYVGIYNDDNGTRVGNYRVINISTTTQLPILPVSPCMTNVPRLSYTAGYYTFNIDLPNNAAGYTISYQTCCRIDGIENTGDEIGATYTTDIPSTNVLGATDTDNSARFQKGISIICFNKPFTLDFSAVDPDQATKGDKLEYYFCDAFNGGGATASNGASNYMTPAGPPYESIPYDNGLFNGSAPLGFTATIDPKTGIISGIAPPSGKYVVSVCVNSYRNGDFVNTHRKDFIISVAPCDFAGSQLDLTYTNCKDSTFTFKNKNTSPLNISFIWDFGDGVTSTAESPTHTYSDTGVYRIKLVVNKGSSCADSAFSDLRVFPRFVPNFTSTSPVCKGVPVRFNDNSFATYGPVDKWTWDFGDPAATNDTSHLKAPSYIYPALGDYKVLLTSGSIKGCRDTVSKIISIVDKPPFKVSNDTLICNIDTLKLIAIANPAGTITWSPNYMINNIHSFTPLVSPDVTTTYHVVYDDPSGCSASDDVVVRVVDHVTLSGLPDTTICRTDPVTLELNSDALQYTWTPAATLNNATVQDPVAIPVDAQTTYHVTGRIGKCFATDDIVVRTVPYPIPDAGKDTSICFGFNAQLHGTGGSFYSWSPSFFLNSTAIANPVSQAPTASLQYVVTVTDNKGCPKPVKDSMIVNVIRVIANAGPRDTAVVTGQPLQLFAATNIPNGIYTWTPPTWLNNSTIANPVSLPEATIEYALQIKNTQGCIGRDTINVRLFTVKPDLYVPSAFTPNGDATNANFKPIALGIRSLESFRVYNRWGQLLFATSQIGVGWDGTFSGRGQDPATYVWYAEATDYLGKKIKKKGTVVLIR